jgi:transposase
MAPPLSQKEKIDILIQHERGRSMRSIARQMNCSVATVSGTVKKYQSTGSIDNTIRSTSRTFSTSSNRRKLRDLIRNHRQWTSKHITAQLKDRYGINTSRFTVGRERHNMCFKRVSKRKRPTLTLLHKYKRLKYAIDNEEEEWDDVWFSDEKQFRVDLSSGKVWKQPWEPPVVGFVPPRTISVLVWGAVKWDGRTTLHTSTQPFDSDAYINIIDKHLIQQQPDSFDRLLQDNASQHKSKLTLDYLNNFDVELVQDYPPCSPELNPIEHVWSWMVSYINQKFPYNLPALKERVKEAWIAIPQNIIQGYIAHLPTVCKQIIEKKGGTILG